MSFTRFFHRDRWDQERARELDAHLAIEIDDSIARGMSPHGARDAARRKLGNVTAIREEIYQESHSRPRLRTMSRCRFCNSWCDRPHR